MPYKVFPSGKKFAVHKVGEDGKPIGKPLGTHPSKAEASAQVAALYANEKKPKKEIELGTLEATIEIDIDKESKDYYGNPVEVVLVETSYGPLTFADLMAEQAAREATYEMYELTDQFSRLSRNIMNSGEVEDKAAALMALANEYASLVGTKLQEELTEDKSLLVAKQIAGDNQPPKSEPINPELETTDALGGDSQQDTPTKETQDLFIWKEDGTYRWLAAYSNNRRDNDNPPEIIASESHKEFDQALEKGEWPMPELWVWHIPYPVGKTLFHAYDEQKGFPIAGGIFNEDWVAEGLINAKWNGVSHGMPSEWIQRSKEDSSIIVRHRTKEISILPQWAAANKLAFTIISKENIMADQEKGLPQHKRENLLAAFGEDKAKLFEEALADKAQAADANGTEKKEVAEEAISRKEIADLLTVVKDMFTSMDTRLKTLETPPVEKEEEWDLVSILKGKSAIGKDSAKIDGRTSLAKDAPEEAKEASATQQQVGVPVGLLDGLFQLNQDWYGGSNGKR